MSNEWYTPAKYVDAAREVFGGVIDLDPASCALANETVKATRYYTREENGLAQRWYGNVFCNPPFSIIDETSGAIRWAPKLIAEYEMGNIHQAIILIPVISEKKWFAALLRYLTCFVSMSVHYRRPGKKTASGIGYGTAFTYLGPNEPRFIEVFSQFGRIVRAVDVPTRQEIRQLELAV